MEACKIGGKEVTTGIRVVNMVDTKSLIENSRTDLGLLLPEQYVVCCGRLDYMKRIDTVIEAIAMMPESTTCALVIVGDGLARKDLEELAQDLGVSNKVIFTGWLTNSAPVVKNGAALVLASEFEGFSNSVLEAMFLKVPVITSLCSSDASVMCETGAALGFEVGNSQQLLKKLKLVITNKSIASNLVDRGYEYSQSHELSQAISFYEKMFVCSISAKE